MDQFVAAHVIKRLSGPDAADLLVDDARPDAGVLATQAQALRVRMDDAAAAYADGGMELHQLRTITQMCREKLAEIDRLRAHTSRAPVLRDLVGAADVAAVWSGLPLDRRRTVVSTLVEVTLLPGGAGQRELQPGLVRVVPKQ